MPFLSFSLPGAKKSRGILLAIVALLAGLSLSGQPWDPSTSASATRQVNVSPAPQQPATKAASGHVVQTTRKQITDTYGKLPLSFEVNDGQFDARVKFLSRGSGYSFFLTSTEAVLALNRSVAGGADKLPPSAQRRRAKQQAAHTRPEVLRMRLAGANPAPAIAGVDALPGTSNYFTGDDPARWRTNVAHYSRVRYEEVYPGIDLVYYGNQRQLEYDFVVAAGADPELIRVRFAGARKVEIERGGDLVLHTAGGQVRQHKPFVYQEVEGGGRQQIASSYVLTGKHEIGFRLARYDATKPLIIDPVLVYSTYLGGNASDTGEGIAVDAEGNAYITGETTSTNFPTQSPVQPAPSGSGDVFVTKLNSTGTALVYSTYVGGSQSDKGYAIEVDNAGNAYVTGSTLSSDFPKANAYDSTFGGGDNPFLLKLNEMGDALLYSTYVGNSGAAYALAVDKATGEAYIAGATGAPDFPVTPGAFQTAIATSGDAFITKFNAQGSGLIYSTYLGSNGGDAVYGIAVDSAGNVYATGETTSTLFFVTPDALDKTCGECGRGRTDGFVVKLNPQGSDLIYSTFLGGIFSDFVRSIDVDSSGHAYVTGKTERDFPTTANAFDPTSNGFNADIFVTKINANASGLIYSTHLGSNNEEFGTKIKVDASGNAHVTGRTSSSGFESTPFPIANSLTPIATGQNTVVTKLNATGTALIYSTAFGAGAGNDIALDASGNAYVTGFTTNTVPLTPGAFQTTRSGSSDAYVAKIAPSDSDGITPSISISNARVTEGNSGTTNADFTATLSAPSDRVVTFDYSTANSTAGNNDYQSAQGTVSFAPGETSKVLSVAVIGDLTDEADETFDVISQNAVGGIFINSHSATGTIVDDDEPLPTPVASINDAMVTEGNSATTSALFTVSLSNASDRAVFVDFNTLPSSTNALPGTANEGEDYQARSGRLTFPSGETSKTVAILVNGDTTSEPDETFIVELSRAINANTGRRQGHATILNDDSPPTPTWTARDIAVGGDNKLRGLWTHTDGRAALWTVSPLDGSFEFNRSYGPYQGWTAKAIAAGADNKTRALWTHTDGRAALWVVSPTDGNLEFNATYGPYSNWTATDLTVGADNKLRVLWTQTDGRAALWVVGADGSLEVNDTYGPYGGWSAQALAAGADNKFRVLWANVDGRAALWTLGADRSFEFNGTYGPIRRMDGQRHRGGGRQSNTRLCGHRRMGGRRCGWCARMGVWPSTAPMGHIAGGVVRRWLPGRTICCAPCGDRQMGGRRCGWWALTAICSSITPTGRTSPERHRQSSLRLHQAATNRSLSEPALRLSSAGSPS
jgi:hypothetical protein